MNKVELLEISKSFKDTIVLDKIDLLIPKSGIYGLIGRNGAGKSVLLKILIGFYKPSSGVVKIENTEIHGFDSLPCRIRAFLETPRFIFNLTGYENLRLLMRMSDSFNESKIIEALDIVNLIDEKDKEFSKYSFGMKQKLGIACALMDEPDILILDEPFNGLDDLSCIKIRNHLKVLKNNGVTIVIASHIKDDLYQLCDAIFEVKDKRVNSISI